MARSRNIKPAIMDNEQLADFEPITRLLFIYMWMLADREGRLEDRPKRIAAQALPYDRAADIDKMLSDLTASGFIDRYVIDGIAVIQITSFAKHQTPHIREAASALPEKSQSTTKAMPRHELGNAQAQPRSPDSLIPDSLIPDSSVAKATDGDAVEKSPADPEKQEIWKTGRRLLADADVAQDRRGPLLGKLCKDFGTASVLEAIRAADVEKPAEPIAWLTARCQTIAGQRAPPNKQTQLERENQRVMDQWLSQQGAQIEAA